MSQSHPVHSKPLLTREQLRLRLNDHGFPITYGYFSQLCLPSRGNGPPIAKWWGARPLYDLEAGLAWAEGRCKPGDGRPARAG
jgi:hypothetical protein